MKSLYESLLDDFDTLNKNTKDEIRNSPLLKDTFFKIGSDFKTIIFEPSECDHLMDDRNVSPYIYWSNRDFTRISKSGNYERTFTNVDVCKKLNLKFQPLTDIYNDIGGCDEEWFKYFDCEYVINFRHTLIKNTNVIDFSKLKFPIKGSIVLTSVSDYNNQSAYSVNKILPYDKELELVCFYEIPNEPIKGWKCKNMVIGMATWSGRDQNNILGENWEDWINELLKNNPDVGTVYISDNILKEFGGYKKVVSKGTGAKRTFVKFSRVTSSKWQSTCNPSASRNSALTSLNNEVEGWRWSHRDLFECDGATPGNTMGMGNPTVPTDTTPGIEPILPTHPRNKKKIKKNIDNKTE